MKITKCDGCDWVEYEPDDQVSVRLCDCVEINGIVKSVLERREEGPFLHVRYAVNVHGMTVFAWLQQLGSPVRPPS